MTNQFSILNGQKMQLTGWGNGNDLRHSGTDKLHLSGLTVHALANLTLTTWSSWASCSFWSKLNIIILSLTFFLLIFRSVSSGNYIAFENFYNAWRLDENTVKLIYVRVRLCKNMVLSRRVCIVLYCIYALTAESTFNYAKIPAIGKWWDRYRFLHKPE